MVMVKEVEVMVVEKAVVVEVVMKEEEEEKIRFMTTELNVVRAYPQVHIRLYTDACDSKSYTFQKHFPGNLKPQVRQGGGKGLGKPSNRENVLFW